MRKTHLQSNAAEGFKAKLGPPNEGPYTITKVLSDEIYELDMGESMKNNTAHVDELQKFRERRSTRKEIKYGK